ncbi:flagellar biosynthetic protein FliO [Brucepastera parasyntrophica]|uniref:flagellar biosynthetic protein FliO n=1 Tax=Brucepastera parasyntrophica TaxID=2880008 RepID=UPI00210C49C8|nr:flagellar biosynthetic protein FliO [Brucepastera parasyntrophica]ULQ59801.1 flagellar biosynthetic protein FliO [Brucepastera parasyntrophica]
MFTVPFSGLAQDNQQNITENTETPERVSAIDETTIILNDPATIPPEAVNSSASSGIGVLWRIVIILLLLCLAIYGIVRFLKKHTAINAANDPYLQSVASLLLSPNKSVQVITIGSQAFLVGVTEHNISLISEITDKDLIDAMNLDADKKTENPPGTGFSAVIQSFMPKKAKPKDENPFSAQETADFIRKQRNRLQGGGNSESGTAGGTE